MATLKKGERLAWFPCHLLHGETRRTLGGRTLHGPGDDKRNIIIGRNDLNTAMFFGVEWGALVRLYDLNQALWYEAKVDAYHPGAECFAKSITVTYGLYDLNWRAEGPQLFKGTFKSDVLPPACPPTPPSGAAVPSASPPAATHTAVPKAPADFTSTMKICHRVLKSRVFPVKRGGLTITLRARWNARAGCPPADYQVSLEKKGLIFDDEISTSKMPAGKAVTVTWKSLEDDDYYLVIFVPPGHDPPCCFEGDLSVTTFDAPRLRRPRGGMIA